MLFPMLVSFIVPVLVTHLLYHYLPKMQKKGSFSLVRDIPSPMVFVFLLMVSNCISVAWADGCGSSYDPAEFMLLNQPQVNEEAPPQDHLFFVPDIPVLEQPLLSDELRRAQLYNRLAPHSLVQELSPQRIVDLVYQQAEVEKKIEASLILDGIHPMRFFYELNRLRGVIFYPRGTPVSPATLARYIREIAQSGTRQSIPYRRVYRAIRNYELFIDLIFNTQ